MRRTIRGAVTVLTAASLLALAACGSTQPTAQAEGDEPAGGGETAQAISLTDAEGDVVELDGPAERVATLEWQQTEMVLTLGVDPVAVADPAGYTTWDSAETLPEGTEDVGTRGEVNLDALFQTDPDLVIAEMGDPALEQLREYDVPVLVTQGADAADPVAQMKETFTLIAEALGKVDEAEAVLADFDQSVEDAKAAVEAAAPAVTGFVYADAYVNGSTLAIRPFGQGSLVGELGETIGLTNAWVGEVDPAYGLGQTDVEGLSAAGDVWFFYTGTEASTWTSALEGNALWTNSAFVQNDRAVAFPESIWTFGGPRSAEQVLDGFVTSVGG
jgi:ABC-type Fe3+-hydroxamate transport system substrate-binding protein